MSLHLVSRDYGAFTPAQSESVDQLALDQFATTIAALAQDGSSPTAVLNHVLEAIAANLNETSCYGYYSSERILQERASQIGYRNLHQFRRDLLQTIEDRMHDLRFSRLSASAREQKRIDR